MQAVRAFVAGLLNQLEDVAFVVVQAPQPVGPGDASSGPPHLSATARASSGALSLVLWLERLEHGRGLTASDRPALEDLDFVLRRANHTQASGTPSLERRQPAPQARHTCLHRQRVYALRYDQHRHVRHRLDELLLSHALRVQAEGEVSRCASRRLHESRVAERRPRVARGCVACVSIPHLLALCAHGKHRLLGGAAGCNQVATHGGRAETTRDE
jgi:hypothetical protein